MATIRPIHKLLGCLALAGVLAAAAYFSGWFGKASPTLGASAGEPAAAPKAPQDIMLLTAYLDRPIAGAHCIFLIGRVPGKGSLALDKSPRKPDRYGDVPFAPTQELDVEFTAAASDGPRDRARIYDISGPKAPRLRLAAPTASIKNYRLLEVDKDGNTLRVVTLEPFILARTLPSAGGGGDRR
jgi:hypothetical protein